MRKRANAESGAHDVRVPSIRLFQNGGKNLCQNSIWHLLETTFSEYIEHTNKILLDMMNE